MWKAGRDDLARKVRWVSEEDGDGAGYDIASFLPDRSSRLIEVKTTNGWERTPFHITRNELAVAEERRSEWRLFWLWNFSREPKAFELYLCKTKGCESYRKSIRRDQLEEDFEGLLQTLEPSKGLFQAAKAMIRDIWDARLALAGQATKTLKSDLKQIDRQIETMLDRIVDANTGSVVAAYEKRIAKLEEQKILIAEQVAKSGKPLHTLEESFELALQFLSSPWYI